MIKAECHTDDRNIEINFDATPWFEQATEEAILELARCGWRGDYPSDAVAEFMEDRNADVAFMFKYLHTINDDRCKKDLGGFECSVNSADAHAWLHQNRPAWISLLDIEE